jgi:hemolysin D
VCARGAGENAQQDVGLVREGQQVAVKIEAFPFTRYGTVPGRVRSISRDAIQDNDLGLVHLITVALDRDYVEVAGRQQRLAPGLVATVDVKTGSRRIISYLISPLQTTVAQAGHEQ